MTERNAPSRYTYAEIAEAVNARAEEFALDVIGEKPTQRTGATLRFFDRGRLSVTVRGARIGRWNHFSENLHGDMLDLYMWRTGAGKRDAVEYAKEWLGIVEEKIDAPKRELPKIDKAAGEKAAAEEDAKRVRTANWLWSSSRVGLSKEVRAYLDGRSITIETPASVRSREIDAEGMRKLGLDPKELGVDKLFALAFSATDAEGSVKAVQQVFVGLDDEQRAKGKKAPIEPAKRTNGVMNGAAVRLAEPDDTLILAEGPETGLSAWQATRIATWIVLGSSNFLHAPVPDRVKTLILAVDREEAGAGLAAALKAAGHWTAKGKNVLLAVPDRIDGDINDLAREGGDEKAKACFDGALAKGEDAAMVGWTVLVRSPFDGLASWLATGASTIPTVKPLNVEFHVPDDVDKVLVVLSPEDPTPDFAPLLRRRPNLAAKVVRTGTMSLADLSKCGGPEAVRRLFAMAAPAGAEPLFGLEALALSPSAPVWLHQSRAAAEAGRKAGAKGASLAYNANPGAAPYDWSPLSGLNVLIAPAHCRTGAAQAAKAADGAKAAGCGEVRIVEWPLFAPKDEGGHAQRHRRLPAGYDMAGALEDGWRGDRLDELAGKAVLI